MDKEQNQAFKVLHFYNSEDYGTEELKKYIKIIVNLVEKQQKEIEELKAITRTYEAYNVGEGDKIVIASKDYFLNGYFKDFLNDYISKDKIKEKIKELESHIWKDGYMTKFDKYAIHYLEEFLGEYKYE